MPKVTIIEFGGKEHHLESPVGTSLMQAAVDAMVPGILADCGGACSCATCHCYVDEAWVTRLPAAESSERDMLDCALDPQDNSRLCCQIRLTEQCDGLVVRLPKSQV
ncbi:2Fe-2S iron-sulfur cluster-binding protein [Ideonella sp. B508-1]|uniref:2Fe-2S iron-sulfur cluster-binding protein n=1 Tax=Ideonella sp. B508-1 TaxID=137716 RepID=UPI00034DF186|nr:2Fe-2S iron-sulfur cluster-binding protein [Ideonella sp. B508-1]